MEIEGGRGRDGLVPFFFCEIHFFLFRWRRIRERRSEEGQVVRIGNGVRVAVGALKFGYTF